MAEIWQIPYLTIKIQGQGHGDNKQSVWHSYEDMACIVLVHIVGIATLSVYVWMKTAAFWDYHLANFHHTFNTSPNNK